MRDHAREFSESYNSYRQQTTATVTAILKRKVESNGIRDFKRNSNYLSPCNSFGLTKKYCGFSPCTYIVKAKVENAKFRH